MIRIIPCRCSQRSLRRTRKHGDLLPSLSIVPAGWPAVESSPDCPDCESMQWICVKGIPSKVDEKWAENGDQVDDKVSLLVQLSVSICVKLSVCCKGHPDDAAGNVT